MKHQVPMAMDAATPGPEKCFPDSPVPLLFAAETGVCTLETRHSPYSGPFVKYLGGFLAGATRTDTLSFTTVKCPSLSLKSSDWQSGRHFPSSLQEGTVMISPLHRTPGTSNVWVCRSSS